MARNESLSIRRVGAVLMAVAVVLGGYFGFLFVSSWIDDDADVSAGIPADQMDPGATLKGRPDFRVCVDHIGDDLETSPDDVALVRSALDQALADAPYLPDAYAAHRPLVQAGCPEPSAFSSEFSNYRDRSGLRRETLVGRGGGRHTMSVYRTHVYLVEPKAYGAAFGDEPFVTSAEEHGCKGDVCYAVTQGVYARFGDIAEEDLAFALRISLGLFSEQEGRDFMRQLD